MKKQTSCPLNISVLKTRPLYVVVGFLFLCACFLLYINFFMKSPSPYSYPADEAFLCSSSDTKLSIDTESIFINVTNTGTYEGEFNKPYLEKRDNNKWYVIHASEEIITTSELLSLPPGETKEFIFSLWAYKKNLSPGYYRAVFPFTHDDTFFSFEFELI